MKAVDGLPMKAEYDGRPLSGDFPVASPVAQVGGTYVIPANPQNQVRYVGGPPGAVAPGQQMYYVQQPVGTNQMTHAAPQGPPQGRWKDGMFDCCTNLWPSCGCMFIFSGVWIIGQMAEKTGWAQFRNIVNPYFALYIVCFFVALFVPDAVMLIPAIVMWFISIALRIHIANYYNIRGGCFQEFVSGFFCPCLSVPQMARHVYGYTKVYDGDSDPYVPDYYNRVPVQHQAPYVV